MNPDEEQVFLRRFFDNVHNSKTYRMVAEHRANCKKWAKGFCIECFGGGLGVFGDALFKEAQGSQFIYSEKEGRIIITALKIFADGMEAAGKKHHKGDAANHAKETALTAKAIISSLKMAGYNEF